MRGFRYRPRRRVNFARARQVVRAVSGRIINVRVNVVKFSIPDVTSADFDNPVAYDLLVGAEAQAHEVEATGGTTAGTDVPQVPIYSKVVALRLQTMVHGSSAGGEIVRWQLARNPQNDLSAANFNTGWHTADDDVTNREVRKYQIAKGQLIVSPNNLQTPLNLFIKKKTLLRNGNIREGDRLKMVFSKDATGTTLSVTQWGTIWLRANA